MDKTENKEFEDFYVRTAPGAGGYVRCLCRNAAQAEDIVHDGYVTAMRQWNSFSGRGTRKAWLMGILRNTFLAWNRRQKVRQVISLGLAAEIVDERAVAGTMDRPLWEAVEKLDKEHREIIYLRFAGQLSYAELARVLSLPDGTVRSRLHRAIKELKGRLQS